MNLKFGDFIAADYGASMKNIHSDPEITKNSWKRFGCGTWMIERDFRKMTIVWKRFVIGLKWQVDCIMLSLQNSLALLSFTIFQGHFVDIRYILSCQVSRKQLQWEGAKRSCKKLKAAPEGSSCEKSRQHFHLQTANHSQRHQFITLRSRWCFLLKTALPGY